MNIRRMVVSVGVLLLMLLVLTKATLSRFSAEHAPKSTESLEDETARILDETHNLPHFSKHATDNEVKEHVAKAENVENSHNIRFGEEVRESGLQDRSVEERLMLFANQTRDHADSPQESVKALFTSADLPELQQILQHQFDANKCAYILTIICILEDNHDNAVNIVMKYLLRPTNWERVGSTEWHFYDSQERFSAIDALGFVPAKSAHEQLIKFLDPNKARELVLKSAGPSGEWALYPITNQEEEALKSMGLGNEQFWVVRSTRALQRGAVFGLLNTQDDSVFQHVRLAYEKTQNELRSAPNILLKTWSASLRQKIGLYDFFKDKGWEKGHKMLGEVDWESRELMYQSYCPKP